MPTAQVVFPRLKVRQIRLDGIVFFDYRFRMTATLAKEVSKLTVAEKIRLVEDLWDEVAEQTDELQVPDSHKRLLDARLAAHLNSPKAAITLAEFRRRLARRL
jgi:putative addiction module component (TIGR02574 family)